MPRLAPEKRAAGTWTPHPNALPPLAVPDQARYGPKLQHEPGQTGYAYTDEAGGTVATCRVCGWLVWNETRPATERDASAHKCSSGDRCLICGPPYRLGKDGCHHHKTNQEATDV